MPSSDTTASPLAHVGSTAELGEREFLIAAAKEAQELGAKYAQEVLELRAEVRRLKARLALNQLHKDEMGAVARALAEMERERDEKKAALPSGTCAECDGEGEQGGQFCGGYWKCEACGGTGKLATDSGNDWNVIDRLPETPGVELEVFTQLQPEPRVIKFIPDAGQFFYQDCAHQSQNALFTEQRHIVGWRVKTQPNTEGQRTAAGGPTGPQSWAAGKETQ